MPDPGTRDPEALRASVDRWRADQSAAVAELEAEAATALAQAESMIASLASGTPGGSQP
jgi:hypothetical protein